MEDKLTQSIIPKTLEYLIQTKNRYGLSGYVVYT